MSDQQSSSGTAGRSGTAAPGRPAPPPRPPVASALPLPGTRAPEAEAMPRSVRAAGGLWGAALLAGAVACAGSAVGFGDVRRTLVASARQADPGATARTIDRGVDLMTAAAGGATGLLLLVAALALVSFLRGGPRARRTLLVAGLLQLPMVAVDASLVGAGTAVGRAVFLVQGALVVLSLAALLPGPVRRWSAAARR